MPRRKLARMPPLQFCDTPPLNVPLRRTTPVHSSLCPVTADVVPVDQLTVTWVSPQFNGAVLNHNELTRRRPQRTCRLRRLSASTFCESTSTVLTRPAATGHHRTLFRPLQFVADLRDNTNQQNVRREKLIHNNRAATRNSDVDISTDELTVLRERSVSDQSDVTIARRRVECRTVETMETNDVLANVSRLADYTMQDVARIPHQSCQGGPPLDATLNSEDIVGFRFEINTPTHDMQTPVVDCVADTGVNAKPANDVNEINRLNICHSTSDETEEPVQTRPPFESAERIHILSFSCLEESISDDRMCETQTSKNKMLAAAARPDCIAAQPTVYNNRISLMTSTDCVDESFRSMSCDELEVCSRRVRQTGIGEHAKLSGIDGRLSEHVQPAIFQHQSKRVQKTCLLSSLLNATPLTPLSAGVGDLVPVLVTDTPVQDYGLSYRARALRDGRIRLRSATNCYNKTSNVL